MLGATVIPKMNHGEESNGEASMEMKGKAYGRWI
jgi:hypothetical protein